MTDSRKKLRPFRCPATMGGVLLALSTAAGPAAASVPAPLSPSIGGTGGMTAILFKYEDLFGRSPSRPKSFKRIDIDGNQTLTPEELQRAFGSGWQSVLKSLDLNADGWVTREEVRSSGSSAGARSNARDEVSSGTPADETAGTRGKSQGAERGTSDKGSGDGGGAGSRGNEASASGGSRGQHSSSGKADNRGGAAGNGGGSGGNRGRN